MKTRYYIFTILFAIFACLLSSCTKENPAVPNPNNNTTDQNLRQINYTINGIHYSSIIHSSQEYYLLIGQLVNRTRLGDEITIENDSGSVGSKETVHFETMSAEKMEEWVEKMISEGYSVTFYYDEKTKTYFGEATR
ncbi:MAG: hypothetical protein HUK17_01585 [Bacteroidales bacterium]|nr:hypothetical protein [Bacteroidales bacterium]